jgi:hypothetical protein
MESFLRRVDQSSALSQLIPLILTVVILGILLTILHATLTLFNQIPGAVPILMIIRPADVLVGATIYLKTEIDFAILIGRLMHLYPGWRNRVALEIGSALGNAGGTILIIGLWVILKHVDLLLALMVLIASLVLFELAHSGLDYLTNWESSSGIKKWLYTALNTFLDIIGIVINPLLSRIIPDLGASLRGKEGLSWIRLAKFATELPFILGLDDFAGYVPLFNVVNIYGFAAGVIGAHTVLNICLFLSPRRTIDTVKNEYVSFLGTIAFIGLGIYGLIEAGKIIAGLF